MSSFSQSIHIPAAPAAVYEALATSVGHSAFTGAPAEISEEVGGAWKAYGGGIEGIHLFLAPGERIVQAWRPGSWPAGQFSVVSFSLSAHDGGTQVELHHSAVPDEAVPHLKAGWHERYWNPLIAHFSA